MNYQLTINGKTFDVTIASITGTAARVLVNGNAYDVRIGQTGGGSSAPTVSSVQQVPTTATAAPVVSQAPVPAAGPAVREEAPVEGEAVLAPMPGLILEIKVKPNQLVVAGETVAVMEAMKMENNLVTHVSGTVREIRVEKGTEVSTGDVILVIG